MDPELLTPPLATPLVAHPPKITPRASVLPAASTVAPTALLARRLPIDMSLPEPEGPSLRQRLGQRLKPVALRGLAFIMIVMLTIGGVMVTQSYLKLHKVFRGQAATAAALKPNLPTNLLKGESSGRVNILLLGRDGVGAVNHNNQDLTNTMMLASIDPVNHTAVLLSLPTDLWVNTPGAGVMKLNAAWQSGEFKYLGKNQPGSTDSQAVAAGFNLADQTLTQVLGVNIDYNVIVNLQALKQMVDTVGGVSVNVPSQLVDPTMAWQNGGNPLLAPAGAQTLNGSQALLYVSSKETSSASARDQRQRDVLVGLLNKITNLSTLSYPLKLSSLINAFGNNVETDLSLSNASHLLSILQGLGGNISSIDLTGGASPLISTGNMNGQAIDLPQAGLFNYAAIEQFVSQQLKNPYIIKENAKVLILNGTNTAGLATSMASSLQNYGYNVIGEANTPTSGYNKTLLIDLTHNSPYTKQLLEGRLHTSALNGLSNKSIPTDGADFVIIIGNNEANTSQAQAN